MSKVKIENDKCNKLTSAPFAFSNNEIKLNSKRGIIKK